MSATEVRMIPKRTQINQDRAEVKGSRWYPIDIDAEEDAQDFKPSTEMTVPTPNAKEASAEPVDVELEAITVDLTSGIAPVEADAQKESVTSAPSVAQDKGEHLQPSTKPSKAQVDEQAQASASSSSPASSKKATTESKPKPRKVRTVRFAEGTTLPIVDVTPAVEKKLKSDPLSKGPVQLLTDTMQVLKRYDNEGRGAEVKSHQWEQKRVMLTIEGMWKSVIYAQCAVMMGMLGVILAMALKD